MKIEYIFEGNNIRVTFEKMPYAENIICTKKQIPGGYLYSYETNDESEKSLMSLSYLVELVKDNLDKKNYLLLHDGLSAYFNRQLYPKINQFERLLRGVYRLIVLKDPKQKVDETAKNLETVNFESLHILFFCDKNNSKVINKFCEKSFTLYELKEEINKLEDKSWWKQAFQTKHTFIPKNFQKIRKCRNAVMHAHNFLYNEFLDYNKLMDKANKELIAIIDEILDGQKEMPAFDPEMLNLIANSEPIQSILNKIARQLSPMEELCESIPYGDVFNKL